MKSFLDKLLTEAKDRFILKNRNLSPEEKQEIIDFFKKNRQAESDREIDWNKSHKMSYDDFRYIMNKYKSGRKKLQKSKRVKCANRLKGLKPNEDYVHLKTSSREYCTYIPLNYETAKLFNKDKVLDNCNGEWCVGHGNTINYWKQHTKGRGAVPIYVIGNNSKWVVMALPNNKHEVWDIQNEHPNGVIPNFNVKKMLMDNKKLKLYDELRDEYFRPKYKGGKVPQEDLDAADEAYTMMASDIENYQQRLQEDEEYHWDQQRENVAATIERYKEWASEFEEEARSEVGDERTWRNYRDRAESFRQILRAEPKGTGTDPKTGEPIWHIRGIEPSKKRIKKHGDQYLGNTGYGGNAQLPGIPYTRRELEAFINTFEKENKKRKTEPQEPDYSKRDEYLEIAKRIEDVDSIYDFLDNYSEFDDVDWVDGGVNEYEGSYDIYPPTPEDRNYDDYFEFYQTYEDVNFTDRDRQEAYSYIYDHISSYEEVDGREVLSAMDLPDPQKIAEDAENANG